MSSPPLTCSPRFATRPRPDRPTYGPAIAATGVALGTPLLPWQRYVAQVATELTGDTVHGVPVPAYRTVIVTVPRQSGKTTLLLASFVQRCLGWPTRQQVIYAAQTRAAAREKWSEQVQLLRRSPLAQRTPFTTRAANGSESVTFANGSRWGLIANTERAGHGLSAVTQACLDEAFALTDDRLEQALRPAMQTRPDAQLWIVSTAGTASSTFLRARIEQGRVAAERDPGTGVAYFEWSAPDDADPNDPDVWAACMPALGLTGTTLDTLRADHAGMPLGEWRRAYLNQWTESVDQVIPPAVWAAAHGTDPIAGPIVLAVDLAPDRDHASIIAAGPTAAGRVAVQVIDHAPGVDWLLPALTAATHELRPMALALDAAGPARSYLDQYRHTLPVPVLPVSSADLAAAAGRFVDEVTAGQVVHRHDPPLDRAVQAAARRPTGDAWTWTRRRSSGDVTALVAATVAVWTVRHAPAMPSVR